MGFLDRLFGRPSAGNGQQGYAQQGYGQQQGFGRPQQSQQPPSADEQAVRRYQYLLATAPPDKIEQAHQEAFEKLTPQQRQQVLQELSQANPSERPSDDSPASLARSATRMEMRQPGSLFRTFGGSRRGGLGGLGGGVGGAMGMGIGTMLLTSVAGAFIGSAIANEFFDNDGFMDWDTSNDGGGEQMADGLGESGTETVGDSGGGFFGDFGGGDFGGGDFGGGDF